MAELPEAFQKLVHDHPKVQQAYEALAEAAHQSRSPCRRVRKGVE